MMAENPEFAGGEAITTDRLVEMFAMRGMFASEEDEDDESEEDEDDESEEEEDDESEEEDDDSFDSESDGSSWLTDSGDSSDEESNDFDDFEGWRQHERRAREFGLFLHPGAVRLVGDDPDVHPDDRQIDQDSDDSGPPELIDSDDEDDSPDSEENARPRTRARTAARRAVRPPPRVQFEAQDVD